MSAPTRVVRRAVDVALAVVVLAVSAAFVAAPCRGARDGTPEGRLAAAFSGDGRDGSAPSVRREG